jgi:hypothetical protein
MFLLDTDILCPIGNSILFLPFQGVVSGYPKTNRREARKPGPVPKPNVSINQSAQRARGLPSSEDRREPR